MHVNTGANVAMLDLSMVAEIMSMSDENVLVPLISREKMSLHVASSKSQRIHNTSHYHLQTLTVGIAHLSVKCMKQSANAPGPSSLFGITEAVY